MIIEKLRLKKRRKRKNYECNGMLVIIWWGIQWGGVVLIDEGKDGLVFDCLGCIIF